MYVSTWGHWGFMYVWHRSVNGGQAVCLTARQVEVNEFMKLYLFGILAKLCMCAVM
jgi:hypothetical protein